MKKTVFKTDWFSVEEERFDHLPFLNGSPFYRIIPQNGVIILALTPEQKIVLVRQFRPAIQKHTLELPCGAIERNEDPINAAKRELLEETGFFSETIHDLGSGRIMMNRSTALEHLFFFEDVYLKKKKTNDGEISEVNLVTPQELRSLIAEGKFEHLAGMAAILALHLRLEKKLF